MSGADELWTLAAGRIRAARGWSLEPLARLGRPRPDRRTWLAEAAGQAAPGTVIVKASATRIAPARAAWAARALSRLAARGYPVPARLWEGPLDARWHLAVHARLPGRPPRGLDGPLLDQLLALVDLQAGLGPTLGAGGWDLSWWTGVVLFEGWEHWWDHARRVAPATSRRLRTVLEPAWGHRLPADDVVHGDLNLSNVLIHDGVISGVVDWDHVGLGCRAADLAGLLLDWHRHAVLAGHRDPALAPDGGQRLLHRIVDIAGDRGLRSTVAYAAVARLALAAQRQEPDAARTWRRVTDAILDAM
jgi:Phosphotransferase enzyme family